MKFSFAAYYSSIFGENTQPMTRVLIVVWENSTDTGPVTYWCRSGSVRRKASEIFILGSRRFWAHREDNASTAGCIAYMMLLLLLLSRSHPTAPPLWIFEGRPAARCSSRSRSCRLSGRIVYATNPREYVRAAASFLHREWRILARSLSISLRAPGQCVDLFYEEIQILGDSWCRLN